MANSRETAKIGVISGKAGNAKTSERLATFYLYCVLPDSGNSVIPAEHFKPKKTSIYSGLLILKSEMCYLTGYH